MEHRLNLYLSEKNVQKIEEITKVTGLKKAQLWTQFIDLCLEDFVKKYRARLEKLDSKRGSISQAPNRPERAKGEMP